METPNDALLDIAAEQRRVINDPTGLYKDRPDLRAAAETRIAALLLRAGATPEVETAETVAQQQHDERFSLLRELHPNTVEIINQRTDDVAKLEKPEIDRRAAELRQEIGAERYDQLVKDAGDAATPAVRADGYSLKILANHGRYVARYKATAPGMKR